MRLALGLISLLITVLIIAFLANKGLSSLSNSGNPKQLENSATSVKNQTDLIALEDKLNDYFTANNWYPSNLTAVGGDTNEFNYTFCNNDRVLVTQIATRVSVVLKGGGVSSENSC